MRSFIGGFVAALVLLGAVAVAAIETGMVPPERTAR